MDHLGLWLAGLLTLGIYSFLYRDNPWYKLSEATFVGVSAGYWVVYEFWNNFVGKFWDQKGDQPWLWVGAAFGLMMLMRLVPKIGWISRWPLAFIIGATSGLWIILYLTTNCISQVEASIFPLFGTNYDASAGAIISGLVLVVGTFCGVIYFFFSKAHTGAFGATARMGIWTIMITFGAMFALTIMNRMSLLIGRTSFIFGEWLGLIR
ncbi:MAG: hypothetical protein NTW07_06300 [candidate division Zixibacteria bacterium]|nr:hypothetical protein [candidate division Zixibacteria bacterium]